MSKGIIFVMTTAFEGLLRIGSVDSSNYVQYMYELEHKDIYKALVWKRYFAIEVEDYKRKLVLLYNLFANSRVADSELFALDVITVTELLSCFEGKVVYSYEENNLSLNKNDSLQKKDNNDVNQYKLVVVPKGNYRLNRYKNKENRLISANAFVDENGNWTLLKNSSVSLIEDDSLPNEVKEIRSKLNFDSCGRLLEDYKFGKCQPALVHSVVMSSDIPIGESKWADKNGNLIEDDGEYNVIDTDKLLKKADSISIVNKNQIPNGFYKLKRRNVFENKLIYAKAKVVDGRWFLLKNSVLSLYDGIGSSDKAKSFRAKLKLDRNGKLLEDADLGFCTPTFASVVVLNQSSNGWDEWKDKNGNRLKIYHKK